jgi:hypothetical protein
MFFLIPSAEEDVISLVEAMKYISKYSEHRFIDSVISPMVCSIQCPGLSLHGVTLVWLL